MSVDLLNVAKRYIAGGLSAEHFVDIFIPRWKAERDDGTHRNDSGALSECLSSIFCVADLYDPNAGRKIYELDDIQLREKVSSILDQFPH